MADLSVQQSKNGKGVFAGRAFCKGEELLKFQGPLMHYEDFPAILNQELEDHSLQIGPKLYLGPSGEIDDLVNHSCAPNAGLCFEEERFTLIAIRDIAEGEEITWDYSTDMCEDEWEMDCQCGSPRCRGKIQDFRFLSKEMQDHYIMLNVVPQFVRDSIVTATY